MKNLSIVLNIVLLVAVGVLYYLHFAGGNSSSSAVTASGVPISELKIAYINSDTILEHYNYLKAKREILEAKSKRLEQDFRNRATSLQGEITAYQRNANNMTIGQVRAVEEDLGKKQQNLQLFEQTITQELMNDQNTLNKELYDRITSFLKNYSAGTGLQVVFKYDPTSDLLYGGEVLDITQDVLKGLNETYQKEKEGTKVATDTTKTKK
jgi:outer membrane protein